LGSSEGRRIVAAYGLSQIRALDFPHLDPAPKYLFNFLACLARNPTFQNSLDDLPFLPNGYGELVTEENQTDRRRPVVK
jgi:hypothetical protein